LRASAPIRSKKYGGLTNLQGCRVFLWPDHALSCRVGAFLTELFLVIFPFRSSTLPQAAEDFVM